MKILLVGAFLLAAAWQFADAKSYYRPLCTSNSLCRNKYAGYYQYKYNPRLFYYCNNKYQNTGCLRCPKPNLFYSRKCGQCLKPYDARINKCSIDNNNNPGSDNFCVKDNFCWERANGLYANPHDNTEFFSCVNKKTTQCQNCPASLVFSETCQVCVNSEKASCVPDKPTTPPKTPRCSSNRLCYRQRAGWYAYYSSRYFYYCNGYGQNAGCQKCPKGLRYSVKCGQCLKPYEVKYNKCSTGGQSSGGTGDYCAPKNFCQYRKEPSAFIFADPTDNTKFFNCVNKQATQCQSCSTTTVFNQVCQTCMLYKTSKKSECQGQSSGGNGGGNIPRCSDYVCRYRVAGDYELAESSETYASCLSDGTCIKRWCQATNLVYSAACGSCNQKYIRNKEHCNSYKPPPAKPTQPPVQPPSKLPQCKPTTFCKGRGTYLYTPPASAYEPAYTYYNCFEDRCFSQNCLVNLVFNAHIQGCQFPNKKHDY